MAKRIRARVAEWSAWFAIIALVVAACGGTGASVSPSAATSATVEPTACLEAFTVAAGVDEMADTVSDLYPVVRACHSVAEWSDAFDAVGGAGFTGPADQVLRNVCTGDEVSAEALCALVQPTVAAESETPTEPPSPTTAVTGSRTPAEICEGTTYSRCVTGVTTVLDLGITLFAICEYPSGEGDIVLLDDPNEAESACSADGYFDVYNVFDVIELP